MLLEEERDNFLEKLYEEYADDLYKYISNKEYNYHDREDIFQEVMKYTYKNYNKCVNHPNLRAWLYNLSNYIIGKHRRTKSLESKVFSYSLDDERFDKGVEPYYITEEFYENDFDNFRSFLNDKEIRLLKYKFVYKYSLKEIAKMEKVLYSTLSVKYHRIYNKIRVNINKY